MAERLEEHIQLKKELGAPSSNAGSPVDTLRSWAEKTEIALGSILTWAEIHCGTFNM
jgi:hypothetical protein